MEYLFFAVKDLDVSTDYSPATVICPGLHYFDTVHKYVPFKETLLRIREHAVLMLEHSPTGTKNVTASYIAAMKLSFASGTESLQHKNFRNYIEGIENPDLYKGQNNKNLKKNHKIVIRQPAPWKVETDLEYNPQPIKPYDMFSKVQEIVTYLPEVTVNETIYQNFKILMDNTTPTNVGKRSGKMRLPLEMDPKFSEEGFNAYANNDPVLPCSSTPFVTVFPKYNSVTSDGKQRMVFPASSSLQHFLEQKVGNLKPNIPYKVVKGPRFHEFSRNFYSYDIKTCDKTVHPYYVRYIHETKPKETWDFYIPKTYIGIRDRKGSMITERIGYLLQFPSGMYGMTSVVSVNFASAILLTIGVAPHEAAIQGDGIATTIPISHPLLREDKPNNINGFDYSEGKPRYMRAMEKLTASRRKTKGVNGALRWHLRYYIYKDVLNAPEHTLPEVRDPEKYDFWRRLGVGRAIQELMKESEGETHILRNVNIHEKSSVNVDQLEAATVLTDLTSST